MSPEKLRATARKWEACGALKPSVAFDKAYFRGRILFQKYGKCSTG
ncbi:MAG: hypothetical protein WA130_02470 [Candidatus Methanoperedens sp.]